MTSPCNLANATDKTSKLKQDSKYVTITQNQPIAHENSPCIYGPVYSLAPKMQIRFSLLCVGQGIKPTCFLGVFYHLCVLAGGNAYFACQ